MSPSRQRLASARAERNGQRPSVARCAAVDHRHVRSKERLHGLRQLALILLINLCGVAQSSAVRAQSPPVYQPQVSQQYIAQPSYSATQSPYAHSGRPVQNRYPQSYPAQNARAVFNPVSQGVHQHISNPPSRAPVGQQPLQLPAPIPARQPLPQTRHYPQGTGSMMPGYSAPQWSTSGPQPHAPHAHGTPYPPHIPGYEVKSNPDRWTDSRQSETAGSAAIASPWWQREMQLPLLGQRTHQGLSLEEALQTAATRAPEIAALRAGADQRRAEVLGQESAFDWSVFADTELKRDNVPVGSTLDGTTGRLIDRRWSLQAGLRNLNRSGGQLSVFNDYGYRRSNSTFLTPPTQGTGRVTAEYTHPLLRSSGEAYNTGQLTIAGILYGQSESQLSAGMEDYLLRVAQAYWELVLARGEVILAKRAWSRTSEIVNVMSKRRDVDVGHSQMFRAESANATRQTDWSEATFEVRRAQERLLRLINGDTHQQHPNLELLTTSEPRITRCSSPVFDGDLAEHPQVAAAQQAIQAAAVELSMSHQDLQPKLDLILSAYSAGLHGQGKFNRAYQNAWTDSEPGFAVGLNFEYPLGNRRAIANRERTEAQLRRQQHQFQAVVSDVALNIRDRMIAVEKASSVLIQSAEALGIANRDLSHLQTRRDLLIDGSNIADLYLDALLRSQDRLSTAELRVLRSQVDLEAAMVNLQHARGELRNRLPTFDY